jgi:spore coat polysaccharide biosynthesis protein SpsF (cytidylyltransferase family)
LKVLIGIQARSTSTRLPRKSFALVGGLTLMDRVLKPCQAAAGFLRRHGHQVDVAILCPEGDPIAAETWPQTTVMEGPEHDVLSRYAMAVARYEPDVIVRVTGDCPMHEATVIGKHVGLTDRFGYDYLSNVDPRFRTSIDGVDTEVISAKLLIDTHQKAEDPSDREHVTTLIRRTPPPWAKIGVVCGFFDLSHIKLSVDTEEDLLRVRAAYDSARAKFDAAVNTFGLRDVHRL